MTYSAELLDLVERHWQTMGIHLLGADAQKGMLEMLDETRAVEALEQVDANVPFPLTGRRLLEIGCGVGATELAAWQRGIKAYGIEPGPGFAVGKQLLADGGFDPDTISNGVGENLPYPDNWFDVVCSFQVLEHVGDPQQVLRETLRVLKPGGYFVHIFPNYGSVWEGHYGILWIPHLPKALGRLYIRLLGRDLTMIDELQLLSHGSVARMLRKIPEARVKSWGLKLWEQRVRTLEFSEWGHLGRLKTMVSWLHRLHVVGLVVRLGRLLHLETPIVLVGAKRASRNQPEMSNYDNGR